MYKLIHSRAAAWETLGSYGEEFNWDWHSCECWRGTVTGNSLWGLKCRQAPLFLCFFCFALLPPVWTSAGRYQVCHSPLTWLSLFTQPWHSREIPPQPNPLIPAQSSFQGLQTCNTWQPNLLTKQPFPKGAKHSTSGGQPHHAQEPFPRNHTQWLTSACTNDQPKHPQHVASAITEALPKHLPLCVASPPTSPPQTRLSLKFD